MNFRLRDHRVGPMLADWITRLQTYVRERRRTPPALVSGRPSGPPSRTVRQVFNTDLRAFG